MTPRLLVLTTIHGADDTRIGERTIGSLADAFEIYYATRAPAPSGTEGLTWIELRGGRMRRWWSGLRLMLSGRFDLVSIHDPELIPAALLARLLRRRRVVVDVHEHVPGQLLHKDWVWRPLRRPAAWLSHRLLRLAERFLTITLAEDGYHVLFRDRHPVFPNYPAEDALPEPADPDGYLAYVGVVNEYRGATLMVEAVARMEHPLPLVMVGRLDGTMAADLPERAQQLGVDLTLAGPKPHREAMEIAARGVAGLALMADVPNNRWSQPTKVYEYLGMGVPLVASRLPGIELAVRGLEAAWLVSPGDAAEVAHALDRIAADPGFREGARRQAPSLRSGLVWPGDEVRRVYREAAGYN
jgi:glycosyltransferase involved in cell wall biosynthesis